jgi:hypothetical protein
VKLREDGKRIIDYRKFHRTVALGGDEAPRGEQAPARRAR